MGRERRRLDDAARAELGGTYARLADGVTHYVLEGDGEGPVVVMLHGGTVPSWCFDEVAAALVARGRRVLRYDQFGRGWSDRPALAYTQDVYQRQLDQLLEHLGIDGPIDLLGYSWGGAVAVRQARRHPERVRRLMFVAPVVHYPINPIQGWMSRSGFIGRVFMATVAIRTVVKRASAMLEGHPDWVEAFDRQTRFHGFQQALMSFVRDGLSEDYLPDYEAVSESRKRVLLMRGTADAEISQQRMDTLRGLFDDVQFVPIEGAGHGVFAHHASAVADAVGAFIEA